MKKLILIQSGSCRTFKAFIALGLTMACFALLPRVQAADGGLPNFNTAEGDNALFSLNAGAANTAVGWRSLFTNADNSFNTGVGAGTLVLNTGDSNTAVGAAALLLNTTGADNTAVGTAALLNNVDSTDNVVIGSGAGGNLVHFGGNIYIGSSAGGSSDEVAFIRIGTPTIFGFPYDTYIAGIKDRGVELATAAFVFADGNQKIGTIPVDADGNKVAIPSPQAMLDGFLKAQTRVAELEGTVERLAATVKEQSAQIQKVSAQLEVSKPAPQVVVNKPKSCDLMWPCVFSTKANLERRSPLAANAFSVSVAR